MKRVSVGFHHTAGGDSLLPKQDRGFFDGYEVEVEAATPQEAGRLGTAALAMLLSFTYPDWPRRATEDLCAEVYVNDVELEHDDELWDKPFLPKP